MIKIISIKKEAKRYTVIITKDDDKYTFKISEDLLIESRFFAPREIKDEEFQKFMSNIYQDAILLEGMKYLDKRPHSEMEVRNHLLSHTSSNTIIDKVIEILKSKGMLDDEYYKSSILDTCIYDRRDGYNLIVQKLKELGLDESFDYPVEALKDNIKYLTIKYNQKTKSESLRLKIQKCQIHLLRKGYRDSEISRYFDESLITSIDE